LTTAKGDLPGTHVEGQMIFVPSIIVFGIMVAAYVNLGAKLATLRHDGVLKRIRTTPMSATAYLSGVLGSTAETAIAITARVAVIGAIAFGAIPRASGLPEIAGGLVLGVVGALAQNLEQGYSPVAHAPATDLLVLLDWTAAGCAFATWRFRWH
jgi:hypothetical protein